MIIVPGLNLVRGTDWGAERLASWIRYIDEDPAPLAPSVGSLWQVAPDYYGWPDDDR